MSGDVRTHFECEICRVKETISGAHASGLPSGWLRVALEERTTFWGSPSEGRYWDRWTYTVCSRTCAAEVWASERAPSGEQT